MKNINLDYRVEHDSTTTNGREILYNADTEEVVLREAKRLIKEEGFKDTDYISIYKNIFGNWDLRARAVRQFFGK